MSRRLFAACQPPNKQPTVISNRWRAASAPFHYALASRFIRQRAAAEQQLIRTHHAQQHWLFGG
jgi:hypothetical protein